MGATLTHPRPPDDLRNTFGPAPERSLVQRMEALQRANDIRTRRAQLKRDLKAGRQPIDRLLLEPPEYLATAKVFDLLLAVPKYGRVKVNKILGQCKISPSKTVGGLSERQRRELVTLMRGRCPTASVARPLSARRPAVPRVVVRTAGLVAVACPKCHVRVLPGEDGRCLWCSTSLQGIGSDG